MDETATSGDAHHETGIAMLRLLSLHHRIAPLHELERTVLQPSVAADLRARLLLRGISSVVLSTCHRTELYWCALHTEHEAIAERELFDACVAPAPRSESFARLSAHEAAAHLFRVAAGLESVIVGEAEILGQVGEALESAENDGAAGELLAGLFRCALRFGRRARAETRIGEGAMSVASAAVQLFARACQDPASRTVLVVGAGTTALTAGRQLRSLRVGTLVLASRTPERAHHAAEALGARAAAINELPRWLREADSVFVAVRTQSALLTSRMVQEAMAVRGARSLLIVDLSLPRAVDPAVRGTENVALHDLAGLAQVIADNRACRQSERPRVEALLQLELGQFRAWVQHHEARPLVKELRLRAEAIRRAEVDRALVRGAIDREQVEDLTRRIVNRLLHAPTMALKSGKAPLGARLTRELREWFGLSGENPR